MGEKRGLKWVTSGEFLYNRKLALILWFGLAFYAVMICVYCNTINIYTIYKHVYLHTLEHKNLYLLYPDEYQDVNLYGPVFSVVIAPFAIFPDWLGVILWVMFSTLLLYIAIIKLPIAEKYKTAILVLCSVEMMNTAGWLQTNALIAACIIFAFVFTRKGKEGWALFFVVLGTLIKIYGIVGLGFFFFSRNKVRYIMWFIIWSAILFILPAIFSGVNFLLQSYQDWFHALTYKAAKNVRMDIHNDYQDISVMGMIRRIFNYPGLNDMLILVPALLLFAGQYLFFKYFKDIRFQLYILCSILLFTVIYSTGSESPTYIIAFPAICIWYLMQPKSRWVNAFFVFALIMTCFSYSDILTPYVRTQIVRPYSLKALPSFMAWLIITYQVYTKQFLHTNRNLAVEK